ncbi:DUF397 domain-containing protein [Streptosporangium sp. NPDC006007]|uniref:DUF397 domain-containing protein n=1 Tax=Streptosporangium sp. NPDC006007 TaxID=3154575 RepID=UPI0033A0179B
MSELDLSRVVWRKSSCSGAGQNCVEVGVWHKSSLSGNGSNCIEVTLADDVQAEAEAGVDSERLFVVRDSKDPKGTVLAFSPSEWAAFLSGVKGSNFDDLTKHRGT